MDLVISLASEAPSLTVHGEIYESPTHKDQLPKVSDVIAANGKSSHFALPSGRYEYKFHVVGGIGKFRVRVRRASDDQLVAEDEFDTAFGFSGKDLPFEVRE